MTPSDEMRGLIERIEASSGGSRNLEFDIFASRGWSPVPNPTNAGGLFGRWQRDGAMTGYDGPPRYTTSVDEALRLLPEGWAWSVVYERERELSGKTAFFADMRHGYRTSYENTVHAWAATPALALCAASLKARMSQNA